MKRNMLVKIFTLCLVVLLGVVAADAENFQTIVNNGSPQNRVDIAILGDGYTAAELNKYQSDVQTFVQRIFAEEPYKEYQRYYNVHRIEVVSNQSGADHPDRNPQVFVDTALDAAYNCNNIQRLICVDNTKVNQVISRTLPASHFDVILVIVNDPEFGGSGGSVAVASTNTQAVEIILHEVGHSFGLLADEYAGGGPLCNPNVEPSEPNATSQTVLAAIKWNHWINAGTPIPTTTTTPATPGLYAGSKYCDAGLYRPTNLSKMNVLGNPFEQINTEQHVKRIYNFVTPLDSSSPTAGSVTLTTAQSQAFSVTTPVPLTHNLSIAWLVDGQAQGNGLTFTLNASTLTPGNHTVRVTVADPTNFVRNDPQQVLTAARTWNITVQPSGTTGNRKTVGVFRPTNGITYLRNSNTGGFADVNMVYGVNGDTSIAGDWNGDRIDSLGIYRNGVFYLRNTNTTGPADIVFAFGSPGDQPVAGDWNGDGTDTIGVYRPTTGVFLLRNSNTAGNPDLVFVLGNPGDVAIAGDWNGDGVTTTGVFRPTNGIVYLKNTNVSGDADIYLVYGVAGDKPLAGDWDGNGQDSIGIYRNGVFYLRNSNTQGVADIVFAFGNPGDEPIAGDWDGLP